LTEERDCAWLYWCPGLTLAHWREERRLVEERFSLFRPFAEAPFFGFRRSVNIPRQFPVWFSFAERKPRHAIALL
jgi:hypothetical protein